MQVGGEAPPLTVVFVGPHPEWMSAYLQSQRVRATFVALTPAQYRAQAGMRPFHSFYRLRNGRVADVLAPNATPAWEARLRTGETCAGWCYAGPHGGEYICCGVTTKPAPNP
jgi:hypothetical protein